MEHDDTDDVADVEQDEHGDGECGACHGSGGGDGYLRCPFCSGRGYVGRTRAERETYHYDCDRWDGYEATDAEVNW